IIATQAEWQVVWAKVNPTDKLPEVDFTKQFLVLSMQDAADPDPGSAFISISKDDKGIIAVNWCSWQMEYAPSDKTIYRFYKVSREGATGVNVNGEAMSLPAPHTESSPVQNMCPPSSAGREVAYPVRDPGQSHQRHEALTPSFISTEVEWEGIWAKV